MKAAILKKYNKNHHLEIIDCPLPEINHHDLLVKVIAAGVNPLDHMIASGKVKLIVPYSCPVIMGNEFSGIVEKVGKEVTDFQAGDRVYGRMPLNKIGAFSEYIAIDEKAIAKIPSYLSDIEAAAIPLTAMTAMQAYELMNPQPGQTIFISGGTGSLGAMAIPIAKALGLRVITNGSATNKKRVLALGADQFIDYRKEDYSQILTNVDFVLDTLGSKELKKEFSVLKPGGTIVSLKGMPNKEFAIRTHMPLYKRILFSLAGRQYDRLARKNNQKYHFIFVHEDGLQLRKISEILEKNQIHPAIDQIYNLSDINQALTKVKNGNSKGKTIISINVK